MKEFLLLLISISLVIIGLEISEIKNEVVLMRQLIPNASEGYNSLNKTLESIFALHPEQ